MSAPQRHHRQQSPWSVLKKSIQLLKPLLALEPYVVTYTYPRDQTYLTRQEQHVAGLNRLGVWPNCAWSLVGADTFLICRGQKHGQIELMPQKVRQPVPCLLLLRWCSRLGVAFEQVGAR